MERGWARGEVGMAAGASVPQLEYWANCGLLVPDRPGGRYSSRQLSQAGVLVDAAALGMPTNLQSAVLAVLGDDPVLWPETLWVDLDGSVGGAEPEGPGWLLRPLARRQRAALVALAS